MKYLTIENEGSFPRICAEMIGLSTREGEADNPDTFGQFGSGTKFAPLAALRAGIEVYVSSTDEQGPYLLAYNTEPFVLRGKEYRSVHFCYWKTVGETVLELRKPANWEWHAGRNWDKAVGDDEHPSFRVLREYVCNARDCDPGFRIYYADTVRVPLPEQTAVTLANTEEFRGILSVPERYLKFLSTQVALHGVRGLGHVYPRSQPAEGTLAAHTRLFVQGVMVYCSRHPSMATLFDYSLDDKLLVSEEREIRDFGKYYRGLATLIASIQDPALCDAILEGLDDESARLEDAAMAYLEKVEPKARDAWRAAVERRFGGLVAVGSYNLAENAECQQLFGYTVVSDPTGGLGKFLRKLGYPKAKDIVASILKMKFDFVAFEELPADDRLAFLRAFATLGRLLPGRTHLPIYFYHPHDERVLKKISAFCGTGDRLYKEIWIGCKGRRRIGKTEQELFLDLLHESRHCASAAGDYERKFVAAADNEVLALAYGAPADGAVKARMQPQIMHRLASDIDPTANIEVDLDGRT